MVLSLVCNSLVFCRTLVDGIDRDKETTLSFVYGDSSVFALLCLAYVRVDEIGHRKNQFISTRDAIKRN